MSGMNLGHIFTETSEKPELSRSTIEKLPDDSGHCIKEDSLIREIRCSGLNDVMLSKRFAALGVEKVDLWGIPVERQKTILSAMEEVCKQFPEAIGCVTEIRIMPELPGETLMATCTGMDEGRLKIGLALNPNCFTDPDFEATIQECTESHYLSGIGLKGVVSHEMGHALHFQLAAMDQHLEIGTLMPDGELRLQAINTCSNDLTTSWRDAALEKLELSRDDICNVVSEYADYSAEECFAECVSEYMTFEKPRDFSSAVVSEYRAHYQQSLFASKEVLP